LPGITIFGKQEFPIFENQDFLAFRLGSQPGTTRARSPWEIRGHAGTPALVLQKIPLCVPVKMTCESATARALMFES